MPWLHPEDALLLLLLYASSLRLVNCLDCFNWQFSEEFCCSGGAQQGGNLECWDSVHTFDKCCQNYVKRTYPFGDLTEGAARPPFNHAAPKRELFDLEGDGDEQQRLHRECMNEIAKTGWWAGDACKAFIDMVDNSVKRPALQNVEVDYIGSHYRLALHRYPFKRFVSPVFDMFYKTKMFPRQMWKEDDFAMFEAGFNALLKRGSIAVDAGGNIGGYTQLLATAVGETGRVHSFEPFRLTFQMLNANVVLGGFTNVITWNNALSHQPHIKFKQKGVAEDVRPSQPATLAKDANLTASVKRNISDDPPLMCENFNINCDKWASSGDCEKNPTYMHRYCMKSCYNVLGGNSSGNCTLGKSVAPPPFLPKCKVSAYVADVMQEYYAQLRKDAPSRPFTSFAYGTDIHDPAQQTIWNSLVIGRNEETRFEGLNAWIQPPSPKEEVEHIRLDDVLERYDRRGESFAVDFIKMDIEGMENHALLGALALLERYQPSILVEIKGFQRTQVLRFLIDACGYHCHSVLSTNPSDFFCWHPVRVQRLGADEYWRIVGALNSWCHVDKVKELCKTGCFKRGYKPAQVDGVPDLMSWP